jgi:GH15 family glucan-1,4-alpha-glucosidase
LKIEDYALIGDCHTAALVGRNGSIDWLCWPRFDSPACFAALLGSGDNGFWKISPVAERYSAKRHYRPGTLVLETEFETAEGAVSLIDFMPARSGQADLVRIVVGRRGRVAMQTEGVLRFDYGSAVPWVTLGADRHSARAIAGPDQTLLCSPVPLENRDRRTCGRFEIAAGEKRGIRAHAQCFAPGDPATRRSAESARGYRGVLDGVERALQGERAVGGRGVPFLIT